MLSEKFRIILGPAQYLVFLSLLVALWVPVIAHYNVPEVTINDQAVAQSRDVPSDSVLLELTSMDVRSALGSAQQEDKGVVLLTAERLLGGDVRNLTTSPQQISIPFAPGDLEQGLPRWRLAMASLIVPRVFLEAYEVSGREEFLASAKNVIVELTRYERGVWLPKGMLWNDHALSERVFVLAKFWYFYRRCTNYEPEVAKAVLEFASRSGQLLAEDTHFTFNTNHGVMQNLALLQLALAFPTLPNRDGYIQIALQRMSDQMDFYINDEGVVLEHSPGYQEVGLKFLSMAMKYLMLMDIQIPRDWIQKYQRAMAVYARLIRPDGSLPKIGDTGGDPRRIGHGIDDDVETKEEPEHLRDRDKWWPPEAHSLWPAAGYAVWWNGVESWPNPESLAQTVTSWSYFPGHAHKHADEMSVILWAGGQTWWTNVGYWPPGVAGRLESLSWEGSNAPHLIDEPYTSTRSTKLTYFGSSNQLAVIDLERRSSGYVARRQMIYLKPNVWTILDMVSSNEASRTVWTTSHNVKLTESRDEKERYCLQADHPAGSVSTFILGSAGNRVKTVAGSRKPFAGWEVVGDVSQPASAIVVEQGPTESWSAILSIWHQQVSLCPDSTKVPRMMEWTNAEDWVMVAPLVSEDVEIARKGSSVSVRANGDLRKAETLALQVAPDVMPQVTKIRDAYERLAAKYPGSKAHPSYRKKATLLLIVMFSLQETSLFLFTKTKGRAYLRLRLLSIVGWLIAGLLLVGYFDALLAAYKNL
jgi:hypothetical protein